MDKAAFDGIIQGLKETKAFLNGDPAPVRVHIPSEIDVAALREKSGLSQALFADRIGVSVGTLRNWEQGRRVPDGPARVLLAMLARNPRVVEDTLAHCRKRRPMRRWGRAATGAVKSRKRA
jgi:putative transcriptional regulator